MHLIGEIRNLVSSWPDLYAHAHYVLRLLGKHQAIGRLPKTLRPLECRQCRYGPSIAARKPFCHLGQAILGDILVLGAKPEFAKPAPYDYRFVAATLKQY